MSNEPFDSPMIGREIREILDLARWAPSGDNTQPWRFEPVSDRHVRVHGFDTREHCVYDLDGRPSRLSIGALLETIDLAASTQGWRARVERDRAAPEARPRFDVYLEPAPDRTADPLVPAIRTRAVQRRPMSARSISEAEKQALEAAVGPDHEVLWFDGFARRRAMAWLMFRSAHIRLTTEEAYRVHASIIEWGRTVSEERLPDAALGVDPMTLVVMRWVMASWPRARFVSRYLGGTLAPRIQMDLIPGLACGAHVAIATRREVPPVDLLDADIAAGRAVQRFWLTAETLGLRHQPEMTPLIFSRYADEGRRFSVDEAAIRTAAEVRDRLDALLGADARRRAVWIGRIGAGRPAQARSVRRPLEQLLVSPAS